MRMCTDRGNIGLQPTTKRTRPTRCCVTTLYPLYHFSEIMPLFRKKAASEKPPVELVYTLPLIKSPSMPEIGEAMGLKQSTGGVGKVPINGAKPFQFHKPTGYKPSIDLSGDRRKSAAFSILCVVQVCRVQACLMSNADPQTMAAQYLARQQAGCLRCPNG
jgi:hypothetical protein